MMETATETSQPKAHSKIGLAAFYLALIPWAFFCCYLVYLYLDFTNISNKDPQNLFGPPEFYLISVLLCALLALASLGLGIWSLRFGFTSHLDCDPERNNDGFFRINPLATFTF